MSHLTGFMPVHLDALYVGLYQLNETGQTGVLPLTAPLPFSPGNSTHHFVRSYSESSSLFAPSFEFYGYVSYQSIRECHLVITGSCLKR